MCKKIASVFVVAAGLLCVGAAQAYTHQCCSPGQWGYISHTASPSGAAVWSQCGQYYCGIFTTGAGISAGTGITTNSSDISSMSSGDYSGTCPVAFAQYKSISCGDTPVSACGKNPGQWQLATWNQSPQQWFPNGSKYYKCSDWGGGQSRTPITYYFTPVSTTISS